MAVGGIKGGGGKGKAGGAGGAGPAKKSGGATFGKVDRAESNPGVSGLVGSGNVGGASGAGGAQGAEPVLAARAAAIAQALKNGEIKTKQEATKKFVQDILKEKMRMNSKALSDKIADALNDDPRLNQALERLWSQG